jgi:molybdate transport system substrate-binding protein
VYQTDAEAEPILRAAFPAPPGTHQAVVYPIAVLKNSRHPEAARSFAEFLAGPKPRVIFQAQGFTVAAL